MHDDIHWPESQYLRGIKRYHIKQVNMICFYNRKLILVTCNCKIEVTFVLMWGGGLLRTLAEQPTISYGTYRFALFFLFLSCALYVIGGIHNFTDNRTLSSGKQKHGNVSKWPCTPKKAQKIPPKSSNCCPRISVGRWGKRQNCWHDFCYCRHLLSMSGEFVSLFYQNSWS